MEKYILNNTKIRTANNFGINNIELELEIPTIKEFENVIIQSSEIDKIEIINIENEVIKSNINLDLKTNYNLQITIPENKVIDKPIYITYTFDEDNENLVDKIKIIMKKNSKANFFIKYVALSCLKNDCQKGECDVDKTMPKCFHYLKQQVLALDNSAVNITLLNLLNRKSQSFIAIENSIEKDAKVNHTLVEFGGKNKISNYDSKLLGDNSENNISTIYFGKDNEIIDINYYSELIGKYTKCNIELQGGLNGNAQKHFKGIINFKEGSKKAIGNENENCILLSDKAKSKSLPVLLCHEEDVEGSHGVSTGKIDEKKMFYIMARGISKENAKKLIIKANFNKIIKSINDIDIQNQILSKIDEI